MAASWKILRRVGILGNLSFKIFPSNALPQSYYIGSSFSRLQVQRTLFASAALQNEEKPGIEDNPFYEKYADKIKLVQDSERKEDNRVFEEKMNMDPRVLQETNKIKAIAQEHRNKKQSLSVSSNSQSGRASKYSKTGLDSVLHMDRIGDLSSEEIQQLWNEHYHNKDCISACIPSNVYGRMHGNAREYPLFIFPLPREEGYEFMFAEFSKDICLITSLLQYQTLAENAQWVLAIRHFTELIDSKGIVLMVGELDTKHLSVVDAQWLGYQIQMYYASDNQERQNLLKLFNRQPQKFDHMSVIEQLDKEIATGNIIIPK